MRQRHHHKPSSAAIEINNFLLSKEAGIVVEGHSVESLKKAIKKYFNQVEGLEVKTADGKVYLINMNLVTND